MRLLLPALLALCLASAPASADDSSWKTDVIALYEDLMKISAWKAEELARFGLGNGPGREWMDRWEGLEKRAPEGRASFLPTPSGDLVAFYNLVVLARKMVLGRDARAVRSAARMASQWAGAAVCVRHPQLCDE